jgi:hypothetical protein
MPDDLPHEEEVLDELRADEFEQRRDELEEQLPAFEEELEQIESGEEGSDGLHAGKRPRRLTSSGVAAGTCSATASTGAKGGDRRARWTWRVA